MIPASVLRSGSPFVRQRTLRAVPAVAAAALIASLALPATSPANKCIYCKPSKPPVPTVTSVTPNSTNSIAEVSGEHLASATKVFFGFHESPLVKHTKAGTIEAKVPANSAGGSTVSVTAVNELGEVGATTGTFTYPIAETQLEGPEPANFCNDGIAEWSEPNGFLGDFTEFKNQRSIGFDNGSPQLLVMTSFLNTGQEETETNGHGCGPGSGKQADEHVAGDRGLARATLYVCELSKEYELEEAQYKKEGRSVHSSACTNYDKFEGRWAPVEERQSQEVSVGSPGPVRLELQTAFPKPNEAFGRFKTGGAEDTVFSELTVKVKSGKAEATEPYVPTLDRTLMLEVCTDMESTHYKGSLTWSGPNEYCEDDRFNAIVTPIGAVQLTAQPYSILYQPPGDLSEATETLENAFSTNYKLGASQEKSNSGTIENTQGVKESMEFTLKGAEGEASANVSATLGQNDTWSDNVKQELGTSKAATEEESASASIKVSSETPTRSELLPGSGKVCTATKENTFGWNCQEPSTLPFEKEYLALGRQPYQFDKFVFLVAPLYAIYQVGKGPYQITMYGAAPATVSFPEYELEWCAESAVILNDAHWCSAIVETQYVTVKNGTSETKAGTATVTITPEEAIDFLELDPFANAGQDATVPTERAIEVCSISEYGQKGEEPDPSPQKEKCVLKNTEGTGSTKTSSLIETETQGTVFGTESSFGVKAGLGLGPVGTAISLGLNEGEKASTTQTLKQTYSDSTAVTNTHSRELTGLLKDADSRDCSGCKNPHLPIPVKPKAKVLLDRDFGTFMFRDPEAPTVPSLRERLKLPEKPAKRFLGTLLSSVLKVLQFKQNFEDVPSGLPGGGAAAFLVTGGFMAAHEQEFRPDASFTSADLSHALDHLGHLPARTEVALRKVRYEGAQPVTESTLVGVLAKTFSTSAGTLKHLLASELPEGKYSAKKSLTRIQAAPVLLQALTTECPESCQSVQAHIPLASTPPPPAPPTESKLTLTCPQDASVGNAIEISGRLQPGHPGDEVALTITPQGSPGPINRTATTGGEGGFAGIGFVPNEPGEIAVQATWGGSAHTTSAQGQCKVSVASFSFGPGMPIHVPVGGQIAVPVVTQPLGSGTPPAVSFSITGLPPGASASFSPEPVTAGEPSNLMVQTTAETPPGSYALLVSGSGVRPAPSTEYTLVVEGAPGGGSPGVQGRALARPAAVQRSSRLVDAGFPAEPSLVRRPLPRSGCGTPLIRRAGAVGTSALVNPGSPLGSISRAPCRTPAGLAGRRSVHASRRTAAAKAEKVSVYEFCQEEVCFNPEELAMFVAKKGSWGFIEGSEFVTYGTTQVEKADKHTLLFFGTQSGFESGCLLLAFPETGAYRYGEGSCPAQELASWEAKFIKTTTEP